MISRLLAAIIFALAMLVAPVLAAATISGTVTDSDTKAPLGSMIVAAYSENGILVSTSTTDSLGHYLLGVPSGSFHVLAYDQAGTFATNFGNDADSFETSPIVTVGATLSGVNFALRRAGAITGSVVNANRPLAGITVAAYNIGSGTRRGFAHTDPSGAYSLALPPGQYKLAAYDDNGLFATRFFFEQSTFAGAAAVTVTAGTTTAAISFSLDFAGHLAGTITDVDTGLVLPGVTVNAYASDGVAIAATAATNASGTFMLNVPAGFYKVVAVDPTGTYAAGFASDAPSFAAAEAVTVKPAQLVDNIRIPLHRAGTVLGRVKDAAGAGLPSITVAAYNTDGSQRTSVLSDASGAYSLALPPGTFRIAAYDNAIHYAAQFYPNSNVFRTAATITIAAGQRVPAVDFSLSLGARFNGTVIDATASVPVSAVSVAAYDPGGNEMTSATSDAAGNYALVLPAGTFRLIAFDPQLRYVTAYAGGAPNYDNSVAYEVGWNTSRRVDFALSRGARISGTVVDTLLRPLDGIQVDALDLLGNRVASATTIDGRFDLILRPDTYKLLAADPLQRFHALFFNDSGSLALATPVIVGSNGTTSTLEFVLSHADRRRPAHH